MPSVGSVLVQYCPRMEFKCWLKTDLRIYAERWRGTGLVLRQHGVQVLANNRLRDLCRELERYWFTTASVWSSSAGQKPIQGFMPSVGAVLVQYCPRMESKCWLITDLGIYAERWRGIGLALSQNRVQMLANNRLRDLCRALTRYWFNTAPVWSSSITLIICNILNVQE